MPGGDPGSDHHDEPEAAGGEGSPAVGERLSREPEGGARDPSSARKDGPHADATMGAAGGNPANPARNHAGGEAALETAAAALRTRLGNASRGASNLAIASIALSLSLERRPRKGL